MVGCINEAVPHGNQDGQTCRCPPAAVTATFFAAAGSPRAHPAHEEAYTQQHGCGGGPARFAKEPKPVTFRVAVSQVAICEVVGHAEDGREVAQADSENGLIGK